MPTTRKLSLRMPLYFPDGNGSLRLDVQVNAYMVLKSYTMSLHIYKKGVLLEKYESPNILEVLDEMDRWYDGYGTKPERVTNG